MFEASTLKALKTTWLTTKDRIFFAKKIMYQSGFYADVELKKLKKIGPFLKSFETLK